MQVPTRETAPMDGPARDRADADDVGVPPMLPDEADRLESVRATGLLDKPSSPAFDAITDLLAAACDVPIALVTLVDVDRQFFPSHHGLDARQTPRSQAFCAHALEHPDDVMVVEDSHDDPRFVHNALVTGPPHIRFYAGMPLRSPSGHPLGTLCIIDRAPRRLDPRHERLLRHAAHQVETLIADATERHRLANRQAELVEENEELERLIADRTEFLAVAKHKLKTPLAVITGWSTTLTTFDSLPDADRAEGMSAIDRAATELRAQIDDLLDEARIHLIGQALHPEPVALGEFVGSTVDERRPDPDTHPVAVDVAPDLVVMADRAALEHVLAHLLDNAVKYSPEGGPIEFSARSDGGDILLRVADRGIGLPEGDTDLFEPFHRGGSAAKTARGTGLGLHIVRLLTTNMGGSVRAVERDGAGSAFEVTLPAAAQLS